MDRVITMDISKMEAAIEAILFSLGEAVHINKLSEAIGQDVKTTRKIISNMSDRYEKENSGIQIISLEDSYQLCSKPEYYDYIKTVSYKVRELNLSDVLIETLSIIAYKQPITKAQIEEIRGVNSNHAVNKLIEFQLVEEKGRLNAPGRPVLFGTSEQFLRCFGFQSINQLPLPDEYQMEALQQEVLQDEQVKMVE